MNAKNYFNTAKENESTFRAILKDLKENKNKRPMGMYVPEDLDTESDLGTLYKKYSEGVRYGIFTILNFEVSGKELAHVAFQDVACMS
jgi:hypothetical protein